MLPVCYKFPHAFLDEPLYGYVKYQNGMSAGDVTETDKLRRIAEHETILLQTAKMCIRDSRAPAAPGSRPL